jgi:hypothetical protein
VVLVDETPEPDVEEEVLTESLTEATSTFTNRAVAVPKEKLILGHKYHLEVRTSFNSTLQAALGTVAVFYDNVGLKVDDGTPTGEVGPTVETLLASDITGDAATLNGAVNPQGTQTNFAFGWRKAGTTDFTGTATQDVGDGTAMLTRTDRITGLTPCTTYEYHAGAQNTVATHLGKDVTFTTDCAPTALTLPAAPVGPTEAGMNASVRPNGPQTYYAYQFSSTDSTLSDPNKRTETSVFSAGTGYDTKQPLTVPASGLTPNTQYWYRVIAGNELGVVGGNIVTFKTGIPTGPGTTGPTGPRGPGNTGGTGNITINSGDERALLKIRTALVKVGTVGRRRGQIRMAIFCRKRTGRTCAGTVKIRTTGKINPSARRKKAKRRVTFATFEYQLAQGKKGYAISNLSEEKLELIEKIKSVAIDISVQVTDSGGNRQTIVRKGRLRAYRTV